jgi:hypothetical protein
MKRMTIEEALKENSMEAFKCLTQDQQCQFVDMFVDMQNGVCEKVIYIKSSGDYSLDVVSIDIGK